eukprot:6372847-Pyramimonas_sp.AAC.1
MGYWFGMGRSEHQIQHWYSLRQCRRDDAGNLIRSKAGQTCEALTPAWRHASCDSYTYAGSTRKEPNMRLILTK